MKVIPGLSFGNPEEIEYEMTNTDQRQVNEGLNELIDSFSKERKTRILQFRGHNIEQFHKDQLRKLVRILFP